MAREYIEVALAREVRERAQGQCEGCGCPANHTTETFCIEHIVPVAREGATQTDNLALSCSGCNLSKGTRTEGFDEVTQTTAPFFHPRRQSWDAHLGGAMMV